MAYSKKDLEEGLVGSAEVAAMLGVGRSTVTSYLARGQIVAPLVTLACGPIWLRAEVERWQASRKAQ